MESTYNHKGGTCGHIVRRLIHICMGIIPWLYYWRGHALSQYFKIPRYEIVLLAVLLIFIFEFIRLHKHWVLLGQRSYEANTLSAVAWGSIGIVIVLLGTPEFGVKGAALGLPLIWSLSFVDPLLGELRLRQMNPIVQVCIGWLVLLIIWGLTSFYLGTPILLTIIIPPIILLAERLAMLVRIDDNFLMLVIPWVFVLLFYYYLAG